MSNPIIVNQQPTQNPKPTGKPVIYSLYQSTGVNVCRDAVEPTRKFLMGQNIFVDVEADISHLPQYDIESAMPIGLRKPLTVFLETGEFIPNVKSFREWGGTETGVYTCPSEFRHLFGKEVTWISSPLDLRKIRRSADPVKSVAQIVVRNMSQGRTRLRRLLTKILELFKIAAPVLAVAGGV